MYRLPNVGSPIDFVDFVYFADFVDFVDFADFIDFVGLMRVHRTLLRGGPHQDGSSLASISTINVPRQISFYDPPLEKGHRNLYTLLTVIGCG